MSITWYSASLCVCSIFVTTKSTAKVFCWVLSALVICIIAVDRSEPTIANSSAVTGSLVSGKTFYGRVRSAFSFVLAISFPSLSSQAYFLSP
jgi:hypothetical protein